MSQLPAPQTAKAEEDDWCDFISVTPRVAKPQPVKSLSQPHRTSTPELPLSVPQLSNIQPPPKPKPMVTQHGLIESTLPPSSLVQTSFSANPYTNQSFGGYQPSLISTEFAARFNSEPDEEWSDFVSGQPPPAKTPNIISNPASYDFVVSQSSSRGKGGILNLPNLEFIVPKSRSSKK